jgi:hypothetical protein
VATWDTDVTMEIRSAVLATVLVVASGCSRREQPAVEPDRHRPAEAQVEATVVESEPCAEIEAEIARVLGPLDVALELMDDDDEAERLREEVGPLRRCFPAGSGAWVLMPKNVDLTMMGDGHQLLAVSIPFTPVYLHSNGTRAEGGVEILHQSAPIIEQEEFNAQEFGIDVQLVDYDGDGHAELLLTTEDRAHEHFERDNYILSVSGDRVRTYPALEGVDIERIEDVDEDGLPDVVSIAVHYPGEWCFEMDLIPVGVPPVLYHARPDGSFSFTDEVARAFLREQCPTLPTKLVVPHDRDSPSWDMRARQAIACARMWGASKEAVVEQIRDEWSRLPADAADESCGTSLEQLVAIADKEPIVSL